MALPSVLLICLLGFSFATAETDKPVSEINCDTGLAHYTELGCKPIFSKRNGRCVERYDCPFTRQANNPKKCFYKNKEYDLRQELDKSVNDHKCSVECMCSETYDGKAAFTCAQVECPEELGGPSSGPECVKQYKMDSCCSENEVCDETDIKALSTCNWASKNYREGERFYPEGTCKECVCTKEYDGTLNGTWCQTINCGIELYQSDEVRSMCAPIYLESRECCPIEWKCFDKEDRIEYTAAVKNGNPDMKCQYGNQTLDIRDSVMGDDECVTCTCNVPPMVTCLRALNC